jgi:3-hydroxyisobutyrate dehydrogenase-like beta-hydroxyacid dehydrogenase
MARIGFVGLGHMGLPLARNLLAAGYDLVVHSSLADAVAELAAKGATPAPSVSAMAGEVDILCSCRVTPEQSRAVFLDAARAAGRSGLLGIDLSTIDPMTSRAIAAGLAEAGMA